MTPGALIAGHAQQLRNVRADESAARRHPSPAQVLRSYNPGGGTRRPDASEEGAVIRAGAWSEPGPFAFHGRHYKMQYVNLWPRSSEKPHPLICIPSPGRAPEEAKAHFEAFRNVYVKMPLEMMLPPGYTSRESLKNVMKAKAQMFGDVTIDEASSARCPPTSPARTSNSSRAR
jgi:hypothetical protein